MQSIKVVVLWTIMMAIEMKIICAFLSGEWENTVQFSSFLQEQFSYFTISDLTKLLIYNKMVIWFSHENEMSLLDKNPSHKSVCIASTYFICLTTITLFTQTIKICGFYTSSVQMTFFVI